MDRFLPGLSDPDAAATVRKHGHSPAAAAGCRPRRCSGT